MHEYNFEMNNEVNILKQQNLNQKRIYLAFRPQTKKTLGDWKKEYTVGIW